MWTTEQIKDHIEAAKRLDKIKDLVFSYISKHKNVTEHEVKDFVLEKFKEYKLKTAVGVPIVAFRGSSAIPHYFPQKDSKAIKKGTIIKLDIWARLDKKRAPFADITWMAFYGPKVPAKIQKIFDIVVGARGEGINYIKKILKQGHMPRGKDIDKAVRAYIHQYGHGEKFIHGTGHSLGLTSPHGNKGRLRRKSRGALYHNIAYTVEPGIYLPGEFGVRSEIDFYITENFKLVITSKMQKELVMLKYLT